MTKKDRKAEAKQKNARRAYAYRRRQQSTSIFFLLWTFFAVLSLVVMILVTVTQQVLFVNSYKEEATREIAEKGRKIQQLILSEPPSAFGENNYNGYVQYLSDSYGVDIYILNEQGELVHPKDPNLKPDTSEYEEYYQHQDRLAVLLKKLESESKSSVVYQGEKECVYGASIPLHGTTMYLQVCKSTQLIENTLSLVGVRTVLTIVFIFLLSFAVSSAVAGWFVKPLTELTKKAHRLAEGDFDVDFHGGDDYGRELVELADSLNYARDELSKTDRMQKELIANVSHDFKTPLTMIKGYASMIIEISGDNPQKREKHAKIIVDEADRLTSLVNDVLDLSKIRSGITRLEVEELNMSDYLGEILTRFDFVEDTQGYSFILDVEEGLYTQADKLKIGQVLYNLIGNAINYTGDDKKVYISLKREEIGTFRFAVTDTGKGIKEEELDGIWERYYRSSETHKRPVGGTGLGLSIVKTVLQRHGFVFGVDSEVGKGSTFYVVFPLTKSITDDIIKTVK